MGLYDRDYHRQHEYQTGFHLGGERTLTTNLVIAMFAVYVVQLLTRGDRGDDGPITELFCLHADVLKRPWLAFELLTYGFLHDVWRFQHIIFNMIALWFFGRVVENRYGKREFLAFFLVAVVIAGLTWVLAEFIAQGAMLPIPMLGASGGIAAVLILFCLNYPRQQVFIWGVLPIPAWVFAILFLGQDLLGAMGRHGEDGANVAYTAHLGGALFGFLYYKSGRRIERLLPTQLWFRNPLRAQPKLRVHDPEEPDATETRVDEILKKIQEQGQDSLTRGERRILEQASREYQKRRGE